MGKTKLYRDAGSPAIACEGAMQNGGQRVCRSPCSVQALSIDGREQEWLKAPVSGRYAHQKAACVITVTINGESQAVPEGSIHTLLAALGLPEGKIAIERNLAIVPRSAYGEVQIAPGDQFEIVQFVGGG